MRFILAALALVGAVTAASAHDTGPGSWINHRGLRNPLTNTLCCGEGDCSVIPQDAVRRVSGGFWVDTADGHREFVPDAEASPSADGDFWRCQRRDGARRCFFVPPLPAM